MIAITTSRIKKAISRPQEALKYIFNYFKGQWLRWKLENRVLKFIFQSQKSKINFEATKSGNFFTDNKDFLTEIANQDFIIPSANRILNNEIGFLGINPKIVKNINWHQDIKSGYIWSDDFYLNLREALIKEYNKGHDIKNVWELSRFHYLLPLALAYYQSGEEKYLIKWQNLILDWIKNNPVYYGPNWINAMEIAIRACNWIFSYKIIEKKIQDTKHRIQETFLKVFWDSLFEHGRFIYSNLEDAPYRSNHYLSDIVGLIYLGIFFRGNKDGAKWLQFGRQALEREMRHQVYSDGVDYELSISYHRYVTELFLWASWLLKLNNLNVSEDFWSKLEKMVKFIEAYTKPNGLAPQIGDSDDSRLHLVWEDFYQWEKRNHFAALKLYSLVNFVPDEQKKRIATLQELVSFTEAGWYIMRDKDFYLITGRHRACYGKSGSHIHNDLLSFELNLKGEDVIIDPGTYVYTPDLSQRNEFRGTAKHNVLIIDHREQEMLSADPFFTKQENDISVLDNSCNEDEIIFKAQLNFWQRQFVWQKQNKSLIIIDKINDNQKHSLEWNFHLNQQIKTWVKDSLGEKREIILVGNNSYLLSIPKELTCAIIEDEMALSYGRKVPAKTIKFTGFVDKNSCHEFEFKIEPIK
ncbi:MAG: hypothetical protein GYA31_02940 [Parcubacteria group bacterium]|nr:hypothetical protein [Parcubacteria group bacterium]